MAESDAFPSGEEDKREQRLIGDLRRMYHTDEAVAQALARVRKRLEESSVRVLDTHARTQHQPGLPSRQQAQPGYMNKEDTRFRFSEGKTWQQRTALIAAAFFVTVLVGSLIVVLTHAHHNNAGGPSTISSSFGAISSIHMLDAQIGWALTDKGRIVRTTDGGIHWKNVTPKQLPPPTRMSVVAEFLTASNAWVAISGADRTTTVIFRTTDAGQTWQETSIHTGIVAQLTFINAQDGWMLSKHAISENAETAEVFHTTDGGKTWVKVSSALASSLDIPPPGHLPFGGSKSGLRFLNATNGWLTGRVPIDGHVLLYRTRDGGVTWNPQSLPLSPTEASSQLSILPPLFFGTTDGILPVSFDTGNGVSLDVYVTHDGGATWRGTSPLRAAATTADFIDVSHGWASDGTLLYVTSDGGQHWTKLSPGGDFQHVTQLDLVSSDIGWAIGAIGSKTPSLLKTVDGGHTWTVIPYTIS